MAWHDEDAMWLAAEGWMFSSERWETSSAEVDGAVSLLGLKEPARVLDLCCGPGRHSIELRRRGFDVTGVDRTERYLSEAKRRASGQGLEIEWVQSDMRDFSRAEAFDGAINLLTSFGYFEDQEEDRLVARNLLDSLKPGGRVVVDMMGKEVLARIFQARDWVEREDEFWLFEREVQRSWSWVSSRWIRVKDGEQLEFRVEHRIYSARELTELFLEVGFSHVATFGSLSGAPYDQKAERLVLVAEK